MRAIGLMSGTSADGIDAALVEIEGEPGNYQIVLEGFVCVPYANEVREVILDACRPDAPLQQVTALNVLIGELFAEAAGLVCEENGSALAEVDFVASHGQTVWHQPEPFAIGGQSVRGTLQIGEPAVIAARTGCLVVADFRPADMAAGGQGAPLVPFADYALFASPNETRAVQNIGGIANVTYLPANSGLGKVMAFDTGPGNLIIDGVISELTGGKLRFDAGGALAGQGRVHEQILAELIEDSYFATPPPRTTGREYFGTEYIGRVLVRCAKENLVQSDILATVTALTAESIALAYRDFLEPRGHIATVIVGGGGVHNRALMQRLREALLQTVVKTHRDFGLSDDAKEAVAFALLGYETLHGRPANVPSATGAAQAAILGKIVLPPNFNREKLRKIGIFS